MGYSIWYEIKDAEAMSERWEEVVEFLSDAFKYVGCYAKSKDSDFPVANDQIISVWDRGNIAQPVIFERDNLTEEKTWIKTGLRGYQLATEVTLLTMAEVLGKDVFMLDGGDWEHLEVWYRAAVICHRIGLDVDLSAVDYELEQTEEEIEEWGKHDLGDRVEGCTIEVIKEEDIPAYNDQTIYGCILWDTNQYDQCYVETSEGIGPSLKFIASTIDELEEEMLEEEMDEDGWRIHVKWEVTLNDKSMQFYLISAEKTDAEWQDYLMLV